jgi:hypothetical protein
MTSTSSTSSQPSLPAWSQWALVAAVATLAVVYAMAPQRPLASVLRGTAGWLLNAAPPAAGFSLAPDSRLAGLASPLAQFGPVVWLGLVCRL